MQIKNHRIVGASYVQSPNMSGFMTPTAAIMHNTAGPTAESAINWFRQKASRASSHFVIHEDGDVTQMVPLNRIGWHAGPSILDGRKNCNGYTHGFEFVNPGFYTVRSNGQIWSWNNKWRISDSELAAWDYSHRQGHRRVGGGMYAWPAYKPAQIETGLELLKAIKNEYGIGRIAGHEEIDTRGWKVDPGPLFPWDRFDAVINNPTEHTSTVGDPERIGAPTDRDTTRGDPTATAKMRVRASSLRVRRGPGTHWRELTQISKGTPVEVLRDTGEWSRISFDGGRIGWVADEYLEAA